MSSSIVIEYLVGLMRGPFATFTGAHPAESFARHVSAPAHTQPSLSPVTSARQSVDPVGERGGSDGIPL